MFHGTEITPCTPPTLTSPHTFLLGTSFDPVWNQFWPPTPHISKKDAHKYAIKWGAVLRKTPLEWRDFHTEYGAQTPTFMAYELRLLWHTNPNFYAIWTFFIGGGGGLRFVDPKPLRPSQSCCPYSRFPLIFLQIKMKGRWRLALYHEHFSRLQ